MGSRFRSFAMSRGTRNTRSTSNQIVRMATARPKTAAKTSGILLLIPGYTMP